jgi:hypothetical protein
MHSCGTLVSPERIHVPCNGRRPARTWQRLRPASARLPATRYVRGTARVGVAMRARSAMPGGRTPRSAPEHTPPGEVFDQTMTSGLCHQRPAVQQPAPPPPAGLHNHMHLPCWQAGWWWRGGKPPPGPRGSCPRRPPLQGAHTCGHYLILCVRCHVRVHAEWRTSSSHACLHWR